MLSSLYSALVGTSSTTTDKTEIPTESSATVANPEETSPLVETSEPETVETIATEEKVNAPEISQSENSHQEIVNKQQEQEKAKEIYLEKQKLATSSLYKRTKPSISDLIEEARKAGVRKEKDNVGFAKIAILGDATKPTNVVLNWKQKPTQEQEAQWEQERKQELERFSAKQTLQQNLTSAERAAQLELQESKKIAKMTEEERQEYEKMFQLGTKPNVK